VKKVDSEAAFCQQERQNQPPENALNHLFRLDRRPRREGEIWSLGHLPRSCPANAWAKTEVGLLFQLFAAA